MAMRRFGLLFLLTFAGSAQGGGQLPPEILMDQLLLRAERLIEAEDSEGALEVIQQILALQEEHGLELPPAFHFSQAQTEFNTGSLLGAKEAVTRYLTTAGRDGELYADALQFLEEVDGILERRGAPECAGQSEGSECWMEVADQPGCHVWSQVLQPGASATWTGRCAAGLVEGDGALTWTWPPDGSQTVEGTFRFGRLHGQSVVKNGDGTITEGLYVDGREHGPWVTHFPDGGGAEGTFVDGRRHGHWIERLVNGTIAEGIYAGSKRDGPWVIRLADGGIQEGSFAAGEQTGHWILTFAEGQIEEGPMLDGKRHGSWVFTRPGGATDRGSFVADKRQGRWVREYPAPDGRICTVRYVDDEAQGEWDCRSRDEKDGSLRSSPAQRGPSSFPTVSVPLPQSPDRVLATGGPGRPRSDHVRSFGRLRPDWTRVVRRSAGFSPSTTGAETPPEGGGHQESARRRASGSVGLAHYARGQGVPVSWA